MDKQVIVKYTGGSVRSILKRDFTSAFSLNLSNWNQEKAGKPMEKQKLNFSPKKSENSKKERVKVKLYLKKFGTYSLE